MAGHADAVEFSRLSCRPLAARVDRSRLSEPQDVYQRNASQSLPIAVLMGFPKARVATCHTGRGPSSTVAYRQHLGPPRSMPVWAPNYPLPYPYRPPLLPLAPLVEPEPEGVATWNPSTPCPVACPGPWSLTNKYSGIPPYVTCVPPSGREIVPSLLALTPLPAVAELTPAGRSRGGHIVAHESVHMIVPLLSDANSYSVNPFESTSTVPAPGTDFVPMMIEPACALVELPPPELGAAFLAQADNAISVAA